MTKQGSVVRTTWSHNSLVSPRCTPAPTFRRSKEELVTASAFLPWNLLDLFKTEKTVNFLEVSFLRRF
ncbi:hypothetical protein CDAR_171551 [Caerostris darwini]|uniref:Uncharacterized protein n=1 Tax=Caerostris darwini TaxID=1538125 RepID=A0AAV4WLG7_9ARAC|nr:hypothetical protein CDAR_171551 [Caerostris darwini]